MNSSILVCCALSLGFWGFWCNRMFLLQMTKQEFQKEAGEELVKWAGMNGREQLTTRGNEWKGTANNERE